MNSRRKKRYLKTLLVFALGYLLAFQFHGSDKVETRVIEETHGPHTGLQRSIDMGLFWDIWEIVNEDHAYSEEVADIEDRIEGAIEGMLESLDDPYTVFMNTEETIEFEQSLNGELEGIGAEVTKKNGLITVIAPLKNSPAANAGIMPGDIIASVDGESTELMTLYEAVSLIRGERGAPVKLEIVRKGEMELIEMEIIRDEIHFDSVEWEMKDGNIAYMEIVQFDDNTIRNLNSAITGILLAEPDGLIIDLRNNSGGYLDVAVDVLSELTPDREKAVLMKGKAKSNNKVIYTKGHARLDDLPLVILMNEGSASASEILAGAVQDWERGTLIGKKTFGKGSVQELHPLDDGATLRITVAKWNTPLDRNIDKEGISPDIEVEKTADDHNNDRDPQLDCALEFFKDGTCSQEIKKDEERVAFWTQ